MNIEFDIFKTSKPILSKLKEYGFKYTLNKYVYEKNINNDLFKIIITIENNKVSGKIIDLQTNLEYLNYRLNNLGEFSSNIKEQYISILKDIYNNCFEKENFIFSQSNRISKLIYEKYKVNPEFLWSKYPNIGVFRNKDNNKWFGIIMNINKNILDNKSNKEIEVINIKLDKKVQEYLLYDGIYEAYHMNKKNWVSIALDETMKDKEIMNLIDISYNLTNK